MVDPPVEKHHVALALIVRGARILLTHRDSQREWYPNCWDLPGGHIEEDESPEQAVRRECREELGIVVRRLDPCPVHMSDPQIRAHGFHITDWDGIPRNLEPTEHDQLRWASAEDVKHLVLADPALRGVLLKALSGADGMSSE